MSLGGSAMRSDMSEYYAVERAAEKFVESVG